MRVVIYISGILGVLMITLGLIGKLADSNGSDFLFLAGLALIVALFLPLMLFDRYKHDRKIKEIIESNRYKVDKPVSDTKKKSRVKGWGMNDSPFRERKSGLEWGGGNIHGAKASRGSRRSFFRK